MKTSSKVGIALVFALSALGIQSASAHHLLKSCPAGTAIQGVDFYRQKLLCVPVGGGASETLKVMDANNQEVGVFTGFGSLARLVNNEWMQLIFTENGFNEAAFAFFYVEDVSANCTGQAYIQDFSGGFTPHVVGVTVNGTSATLYSAGGAFANKTLLSFQNVSSAGLGPCQPTDGSQQRVAVPQTTTISNNPPFRISQ